MQKEIQICRQTFIFVVFHRKSSTGMQVEAAPQMIYKPHCHYRNFSPFAIGLSLISTTKKTSCVRNHPFKTLANFYGFWPLLPPVGNCLHSSGHTRNSWHLTAPKNDQGALMMVSSIIFLRFQKLGICTIMYLSYFNEKHRF